MSLFHPVNYVFLVVAGCIFFFILIETIRYKLHLKHMRAIPCRIHINGSRGKSSTTRLIGAVLRESGKVTITKTTGTSPRFIMPDGKEIPLFRQGKPNIIEQLQVVKRAHKLGAEILAVECMAITPEYISILEDKIIQSSIGVITNIREDHLDVMGPTIYDVATNMAKSLPGNGIAFTAEKKWYPVLEREAKKRNTKLIPVSPDAVSDRDMRGFSYIEHKDNTAIALAVGEHFGVPRLTALEAMYRARPDPGVLRETVIRKDKATLYFFNALAANDPDSSLIIWEKALGMRKGLTVVVLVLRIDRPQRTESFAKALGTTIRADRYIIAGSRVSFVNNALKKKGVPSGAIIGLETPTGPQVANALTSLAQSQPVIACAMGNIVGLGEAFLNELGFWAPTGDKA